MSHRWTPEEEKLLLLGIGSFGWKWFQTRTNSPHDWPNSPKHRSKGSVREKVRRLGLGSITRGSYSLSYLATVTGYSRPQLVRAMKALGQKWKRTSATGCYLISDEQFEELRVWLRKDYWCKPKRLYHCQWCGSESHPHRCYGLCAKCYYSHRRVCVQLGLPTQIHDMRRLVKSLDCGNDSEAKFRTQAAYSLDMGIALSREQLDWVVMMRSEAED